MTIPTEITIETVKELMTDNEYFAIEDMQEVYIIGEKQNGREYTILKSHLNYIIHYIDECNQIRISFQMHNGAYLYMNITKNYISITI